MSVYLGKQRLLATQKMSATHGIVLELVRRVEGLGHKLYMDSYFSSPALFDELSGRKIAAELFAMTGEECPKTFHPGQ